VPLTDQLPETLFNAESTTLELLETQLAMLRFTAHTLAKTELEFAEELPPLDHLLLEPLESPLLLPLLLPCSWLSLWSLLLSSKRS